MAGVIQPTVLLPSKAFGAAVVARVVAALDDEEPKLRIQPLDGDPAALRAALRELLRVGRDGPAVTEPRLDLVAFADLRGGADDLLAQVTAIADLLAQDFGVVFPPNLAPEQRTAALHLIVAAPTLADTPAASAALDAVAALAAWVDGSPSHPVLARIWVVGEQTAAGVLTADDMVATASGFTLACIGAGVRETEPIRARMAHPRPGEGRIGMLAVASLDLPRARLVRYARVRAAFDALDTLVQRVEQGEDDPTKAASAVARLEHEAWLAPWSVGDIATGVRKTGWKLAGGATIPDAVTLDPFPAAADVRHRYSALFVHPEGETPAASHELDRLLKQLDEHEASTLTRARDSLDDLLESRLGRKTGLRTLGEVESGLTEVIRSLERHLDDDLAPAAAAALDPEEGLTALARATDALPARRDLQLVGASVGIGVGLVALAVTLAMSVGGPAAAASFSAPVVSGGAPAAPTITADAWLPWVVGLVAGTLAGAGAAWFSGRSARLDLTRALEDRRGALLELEARGAGGPAARDAEAHLRVRRIRLARALKRRVEASRERLQLVRRTLVEARDRWLRKLEAMGLQVQRRPEADDLRPLLGVETRLHGLLVSPGAAREWLLEARRFADAQVWADHVVGAAWPARGLAEDAPCADDAAVERATADQVRAESTGSPLADAEIAHEAASRATAFMDRALHALAPAAAPRDAYGGRVRALREDQVLLVDATGGGDAIRRALAPFEDRTMLLVGRDTAGMLWAIRTWEGITVDTLRPRPPRPQD